jgi:hypothetical protein
VDRVTSSDNFDGGHPVVLIMTILHIQSNRLTKHLVTLCWTVVLYLILLSLSTQRDVLHQNYEGMRFVLDDADDGTNK